MKQCSKCGEWKEEGMFEKKKNQCKACRAARRKEHHANNREKEAARRKKYYANNREKFAARQKKYRANNREKEAARQKKYYANNREKLVARSKEYYANNREKLVARSKEYYANNQEKALALQKEWRANNQEKVLALQKEWRANNREKIAAQQKEWRKKVKAQAYAVLGGAFCVRCGYTGTALQIDHVNSDGFLDRRQTNPGLPLYKKIIATGGVGYQVLCARCNWEKRDEDNERREAMRQALKWEDVFGVQKVTAVLDVV